MNYLTQIMEFYSRLEVAPLNARAQAFFHCLMYHFNKSRWRSPLILPEAVFIGELQFSHRQFLQARRELVENGYVNYYQQPGNKSAHYGLIDLEELRKLEGIK